MDQHLAPPVEHGESSTGTARRLRGDGAAAVLRRVPDGRGTLDETSHLTQGGTRYLGAHRTGRAVPARCPAATAAAAQQPNARHFACRAQIPQSFDLRLSTSSSSLVLKAAWYPSLTCSYHHRLSFPSASFAMGSDVLKGLFIFVQTKDRKADDVRKDIRTIQVRAIVLQPSL